MFGFKPDDRDDYYEGDENYYDYDDSATIPSRYSDSESGEPEMICPCFEYCTIISYNKLITRLQNIYRDWWLSTAQERGVYTDEGE